MKHPFKPFIVKNSTNMIVGSLPPEGSAFYYSNSQNNRMWDLLRSIQKDLDVLPKNGYSLSVEEKKEILQALKLSMTDIILEYDRKEDSSKDNDIIPLKYNNIADLIAHTSIVNLLFVYKSALEWFLDSLQQKTSIGKKECGKICSVCLNEKNINCILLPNPLSRGKKGETLEVKKAIYEKWIRT